MNNSGGTKAHIVTILSFTLLGVAVCVPTLSRSATIVVLYAMDADLKGLAEANAARTTSEIDGHTVNIFKIGPHRVVAAKMEAGAVNTALTTQIILDKYRCNYVFSVGPAGALNAEIPKGTWFQVNRIVPYQAGSESGAGFHMTEANYKATYGQSCPKAWNDTRVVSIASGELFIADSAAGLKIAGLTGCEIIDMNSFGLAAACQNRKIPFSIWKIVSDHADENASHDFRQFSEKYDGAGGQILRELIASFPERPDSLTNYKNIDRLLDR